MPNESRRSGEKDIGLLSGPFHQARTRLTLIYVAILAVMLLLSSWSTYSYFSNRLEYRFARFRPRTQLTFPMGIIPPNQEDVQSDLIISLLLVNGLLLVVAGISSYWFAGKTLEPIQATYNRQRRFLSDASHELRTPLTILRMDLENQLANRDLDDASQAQTKSHLEEVGRMGDIVNDLLTLSRLDEKTSKPLTPATLHLNDAVQEVVDRLQPIAKDRGVIIDTSHAKENIQVFANKELFIQAISNVVKNAIVYNKRDGNVIITLEIDDGQAVIRIADTGVGIAEEELEKIFDRFYRADESRSRETGGSGLGLAIVESVMKQLNGAVQIQSVLGNGTIVTLCLPHLMSS